MSDILGKFVSIILCVVLLFIAPVMLLGSKLENNIQIYAEDAVTQFVDTAVASGYISAQNYREFVEKLGNTGLRFDLELVHRSSKKIPGEEEGTHNTIDECAYTEDILLKLFPDDGSDGIYRMKNKDMLEVNLNNVTSTYGTNIFLHLKTGSSAHRTETFLLFWNPRLILFLIFYQCVYWIKYKIMTSVYKLCS